MNTKGGQGNKAYSKNGEAKTLQDLTKIASKEIFEKIRKDFPKVELLFGIKKERLPGAGKGCNPDGGVFFLEGKGLVAVEAKRQDTQGNAIERWFKNFFHLTKTWSELSYITFATGSGATNVIWDTLKIAHKKGINEADTSGHSFFVINLENKENALLLMKKVIKEVLLAKL